MPKHRLKSRSYRSVLLFLGVTSLLPIFQNCSEGFVTEEVTGEVASSQLGLGQEVPKPIQQKPSCDFEQLKWVGASMSLRNKDETVCMDGTGGASNGRAESLASCSGTNVVDHATYYLGFDQNDCTASFRPAFPAGLCLDSGAVDGKVMMQTTCAQPLDASQRWTLVNQGSGVFQMKSQDGRCASISASSGSVEMVACDATSEPQLIHFVRAGGPAQPIAASPQSVYTQDGNPATGILLQPLTFAAGKGFMQRSGRLVVDEKGATVEFNVSFPSTSDFFVHPNFVSHLPGAKVNVYQDDKLVNTLSLSPTGQVSPSRPTLLHAKIGATKIKYEMVGDVPFEIETTRMVSVATSLPWFDSVTNLKTDGPTDLRIEAVSDAYRGIIDGAKNVWDCHWSYCYIEYRVKTAAAGTYQLTFDFTVNNSANLAGVNVFVNGQAAGQAVFDKPSGQSGTSPALKLNLPAGESLIYIQNANYVNGIFASGFILNNIRFTPE